MKTTLSNQRHEGVIKNDGSITYDAKFNFLGELANVKGLGLALNSIAYTAPSEQKAAIKLGVDFENADTKFKILTNVHDYVVESTLAYKCCPKGTLGYSL